MRERCAIIVYRSKKQAHYSANFLLHRAHISISESIFNGFELILFIYDVSYQIPEKFGPCNASFYFLFR